MATNENTGTAVESDPQVPVQTPPVEPTTITTRRKVTDSAPLEENEWAPRASERPYAEAVTPAHREFLLASGVPVPDLEK